MYSVYPQETTEFLRKNLLTIHPIAFTISIEKMPVEEKEVLKTQRKMGKQATRNTIVKIDNTLEKYKDMPIFQDKVDKANEMLRTIGLPKTKPNVG